MQIALPRFVDKIQIDPKTGCWEWTGATARTRGGYGVFQYQGQAHRAHRWIYSYVHNQTLANTTCICHRCDNTRCVNPNHLFPGTHQDNIADKMQKRRQARGETHGKSKLTEQQATAIRTAVISRTKSGRQALADQYGVSTDTVSDIRSGRTWQHI